MTEEGLIKKLGTLREIKPNADYARTSRYLIISSGENPVLGHLPQRNIFSSSLDFVFSVALTALFLFVLILGGSTGAFKTLLLPPLQGVGGNGLTAEANTVTKDINVRLGEIGYFSNNRAPVALVNDGNTQNNASVESNKPNTNNLTENEDEIDRLLNEVIQY